MQSKPNRRRYAGDGPWRLPPGRILPGTSCSFINQFRRAVRWPRKIQGTRRARRFQQEPAAQVDQLELSVRSANCLKNDNHRPISASREKTEPKMLRTPQLSPASRRKQIKEVLAPDGPASPALKSRGPAAGDLRGVGQAPSDEPLTERPVADVSPGPMGDPNHPRALPGHRLIGPMRADDGKPAIGLKAKDRRPELKGDRRCVMGMSARKLNRHLPSTARPLVCQAWRRPTHQT